jgi:hypothetical protein
VRDKAGDRGVSYEVVEGVQAKSLDSELKEGID